MTPSPDVAIIGLAGRFPGAADLAGFWRNLVEGVDAVAASLGPPPPALNRGWSRGGEVGTPIGLLDGFDRFDAGFFRMSPLEARITDPQQRLLLETGWAALEDAGYGEPAGLRAAVFATASQSGYAWTNVRANAAVLAAIDETQLSLGNAADFLATRLSYKLDLHGVSVTVQAACASSLLAVHLARQSLLAGECDLAVVAAASVTVSPWAQQPAEASPGDRCRAFSIDAEHTVAGDAVIAVILRRSDDARADGDHVRAVLLGSAVTNDGARKMSFAAPGVDGQARAAREALVAAGVTAESVDYIEGHGSGTPIGDAIELAALGQVYGPRPAAPRRLGSVKSNIGYPDGTAGLAGLAKAVLALEHELIPGNLHFTAPHPGTEGFEVVTASTPWPRSDRPRRAAVASYGMGGTNVHLVLQEAAPPPARPAPRRSYAILTASGRSAAAAATVADRLTGIAAPSDVAFTLHVGRRALPFRRAAVVATADPAAVRWSPGGDPAPATASVVFTVPAVAPDPGAVAELAREEPVFRDALEAFEGDRAAATWHALVRLWRSWGIAPDTADPADPIVIDLGACVTPRGLATALADAWCRGAAVDWHGYHAGEHPRRVPLPAYPFESERHWVDPDPPAVGHFPADRDIDLDRMPADGADPVVATVAGVWQDVLGVPGVTGDDDFFALGGDSLRLLRVTGRLRDLFGIEVPLTEAFRARTLDRLVALLDDLVVRETSR